MSTIPKTFLTPAQYLEIEREAEFRSEYYYGEMFAMSGAPEPHNVLSLNLASDIRAQLRGGPCRAYTNDMRVQLSATRAYFYPDVVVACDDRQFLDGRKDTLLNPTVIIEVLSRSTEAFDRGQKFRHYQTLDSLQEYVLVSQERVQVDRFRRQPDGQWLLRTVTRLEDTVELESIGCTLRLVDIYEDVDLPSESPMVQS